jgi:hypothetical protein
MAGCRCERTAWVAHPETRGLGRGKEGAVERKGRQDCVDSSWVGRWGVLFDLICNAQRRVSTRPSHAPASSRHVECTVAVRSRPGAARPAVSDPPRAESRPAATALPPPHPPTPPNQRLWWLESAEEGGAGVERPARPREGVAVVGSARRLVGRILGVGVRRVRDPRQPKAPQRPYDNSERV